MKEGMKTFEGLKLAAMFAIPPNKRELCGEENAANKLYPCLDAENYNGVIEILKTFPTFNIYLEAIGKATGLSPYSPKVIECYLFGNELANNVTRDDYNQIKEKILALRGEKYRLIDLPPKMRFIPTHNFQVALSAVPFGIDTISECMVRYGKVEKIEGNNATVILNTPIRKKQGYQLVTTNHQAQFDSAYISGLKDNSIVAVHYDSIIKVLTAAEAEAINQWTKEVINCLP